MAVISLNEGVYQIDDDTGSLVNFTNWVITCEMSIENTIGTYATVGEGWQKATEGMRAGTISLEIEPDTTSGSAYELFTEWMFPASGKPGDRSFQIDTPDSTNGSIRYTGECKINNINPVRAEPGSGDPMSLTVELTVNGVVSRSVISGA